MALIEAGRKNPGVHEKFRTRQSRRMRVAENHRRVADFELRSIHFPERSCGGKRTPIAALAERAARKFANIGNQEFRGKGAMIVPEVSPGTGVGCPGETDGLLSHMGGLTNRLGRVSVVLA